MRFSGALSTIILANALIVGCQDRSIDQREKSQASVGKVPMDGAKARRRLSSIAWQPLAEANEVKGPLFDRLAPRRTGVDFIVPIDSAHPLKRLYAGSFFCGGVAIGDVTNDGLPDLFIVSGPGQNGLFRQRGNLRFENITQDAGVGGGTRWGAGVALVDINADGLLDIYVCNYDAPNQLYINQGNARFLDMSADYHLDIQDSCVQPTFCDYDKDGDLDCYLLTNRYYREGGIPRNMRIIMRDGQPSVPDEYREYYAVRRSGRTTGELRVIGRPDRLLRNNGDGTFTDVSNNAGISRQPGHGLSATWWDYDDDGWPDLYVGNDMHDPDFLYRNNGDGTFTDVIATQIPHTTWFSMGADVGDVNNDGLFDFLSVDMAATTHFGQKTTMGNMETMFRQIDLSRQPRQVMRNVLYLNTGADRFMEIAYLSGLANSDWSWSAKLADFDNDGRVDAYITNGMTRNMIDADTSFTLADQIGHTKWQLYEPLPSMPQQNLAFRNLGDLRFRDVSQAWGLDHTGMSFSAATGDLDRDGDLDLVVANLDEPVSIYRNNSAAGHRVLVRLRGGRPNRFGVGAKVRMETDTGRQIRQLMPTTGFFSSNEPIVHFGLGKDDSIRRLTIDWPSGQRQSFKDLRSDRMYTITKAANDESVTPATPERPTIFKRSAGTLEARHIEKPYDDFARQPLLPNKLSQLGPGLAVGDVDGDTDDDIFLSGAAGQSGMLFPNEGNGRFGAAITKPFLQDADHEDMAPLFLDADGDGDLDLYVVSGGVECEEESRLLKDRLYLNDGQGAFSKAPTNRTPDIRDSGSTVAACDFDRDGDLDLYVGARVIPGRYPLPPTSRLLRNDNGVFVDVTEQLANDILQSGMVTAAVWSDANGDGWCDLLVTHEWGPIKLFENDQGKLVDVTESAGMQQLRGWWNGIAARDLDGDNDIDYVVTNFGLNTKYHAEPNSPTLLFCGDFDGTNRPRLIEAEFEGQNLFPIRGRSCSSQAMPFLKERFPTYKSFAAASLQEIYSPDRLTRAHRFEATNLASGVLVNDGTGRMQFRPLPNLAQISPGFGVVLTEVNGDHHADLYLAQNFFGPQIETGRMDGGVSLLLTGNGDATFQPVWPADSGLMVPGDAKSVAITDLNDDLWPDVLVGINNDYTNVFLHQGAENRRLVKIRLAGSTGNPTAVGAKVTLNVNGAVSQTAEVFAGSGYLSQSTADLTFGFLANQQDAEVHVRWPDGNSSVHQLPLNQRTVTIDYPATP